MFMENFGFESKTISNTSHFRLSNIDLKHSKFFSVIFLAKRRQYNVILDSKTPLKFPLPLATQLETDGKETAFSE